MTALELMRFREQLVREAYEVLSRNLKFTERKERKYAPEFSAKDWREAYLSDKNPPELNEFLKRKQ